MVSMSEEYERRLDRLEHHQADLHWWMGRADRDIADLGGRLTGIEQRQVSMEQRQIEHSARFDSLDIQLRSLTQMVGQLLGHEDDIS